LKTGVFGGTFDPVHNGHVAVAEEVNLRLGLDGVLLVPANHPPFKGRDAVLDIRHRIRMLQLAIEGHPCLSLSTLEAGREGLSYTADTIASLSGSRPEDELYFIIGQDNLEQFTLWKEPERIIRLSRLVAVPRPGYTLPDLEKLEKALPGLTDRLTVLDGPQVEISASEIRDRVARGLPIDGLVPAAVAVYIKEKGLYTERR
jgi:nicotinate-nucleotide adenylyltransferase